MGSILLRAEYLNRLAEAVTVTEPRRLELWGWRKRFPQGTTRSKWEPDIRELRLEDLRLTTVAEVDPRLLGRAEDTSCMRTRRSSRTRSESGTASLF